MTKQRGKRDMSSLALLVVVDALCVDTNMARPDA